MIFVDSRSEKNILTLHPYVQDRARTFLVEANHLLKTEELGLVVKIISGTRTYEEQDKLFNHRTKSGARVTKARGGYSNHNFGVAFDVGLFRGRYYFEEHKLYRALGPVGEALGLDWGGRWKSFRDDPHFQLRPAWAKGITERSMLAEFRKRRARGMDLFLHENIYNDVSALLGLV